MKYSNKVVFISELAGTFGLLVAATGSIVYASQTDNLAIGFIAAMHFVGLAIVVYAFGKYSMAHFNPAVTLGFLISGHTKLKDVPIYLTSQAIGAFLGTLFVKYVFGNYADLGTNAPGSSYSFPLFYTVEIIATIFLMGVIFVVVHKNLSKFSGIAIGGIVGIDVYFFGLVSGASMNPIRSLSPAVVSGVVNDLWIYLTAPLIGVAIVGFIYKKKFAKTKVMTETKDN